jgi:ATP-binding cassette subfamily B protein
MTTDVTNIQNAYQMILRMCVRAPFSLITAMVMAFVVSPRMARIYLVAVLILGVFIVILTINAHKYFTQVFKKYDALNESVQENVTSMRVVKAFVREDYERGKFGIASYNIYKMFIRAEGIVSLNAPMMMLTVYSCIMMIGWTGAHLIVQSGNNAALGLTIGDMTSLLAYCVNILMSLMMLSLIFVMVTMSAASAERIAEVLTEEPDITNPENALEDVPNGSIEFKNVVFRYNKTSEKPVLEDINLQIASGETIGIIGGTGSAKSSLVNLISRLYDV